MIIINGTWHNGQTSEVIAATLSVDHWGNITVKAGELSPITLSIDAVKISDRLASLPRRVTFGDGGSFVTDDNQAIDDLQSRFGTSSWLALVHRWESNLGNALPYLLALVLLVFAIIKYGIPYAANQVAKTIPSDWVSELDEQTLKQIDENFLSASQLSKETQTRLKNYFASYDDTAKKVVFRNGGAFIGANAFALPGATVIFTDQLVELAEHDEELLSIYFHEIGHVKYRHGLRGILQSSVMTLFITFITGDGSGIAEAIYALPIVLTHSAYSRKFETESDVFAHDLMLEKNIPLSRFVDIMSRLEKANNESEDDGNASQVGNYFSSHPATDERIRRFSN